MLGMRVRFLVGILVILLFTSGCPSSDRKVAQLNNCVTRPNFDALNCPRGNDTGRVATLKRILKVCDGQVHKDGTLPLDAYQFCQRDLITRYTSLTDATCQEVFVEPTRCVLRGNLVKEISVLVHSENQNGQPAPVNGRIDTEGLQKFLNDLKGWYGDTLQSIYRSPALGRVKSRGVQPDPAVPADQQGQFLLKELADQDQREVLDAFWDAIVQSSKSSELLQRDLDFYTQNEASLQVAEGVVLQGNYPVPLFLRLLGNSLKVLSDRVHYLASIADLGCSIHSCRGNTDNELFRIISLLGSLDDRREFQRFVPEIPRINTRLARFFNHVVRNAESIEQSLIQYVPNSQERLDTYRRNGGILNLEPASVPTFAQGILEIIKSNRILKNSYETSGFYSWARGEVTEFGFSSNLDSIVQIATLAQQNFDRRWQEFQNHRRDHGQHILTERTWQNTVDRLKDESQRQLERITELGEDLNGLRVSLSNVHARTREYLTQVMSVLNSPSYFERYGSRYVTDRTFPPFTITPQAAPQNARSPLVRDLVVQSVAPVLLARGQIASIQIDRNWSPTCALRNSGFKRESVANAQIGPEGYMMSISEGQANLKSVTDYEREDHSTRIGGSVSVCHEASLGIIGAIFGQQPSITTCAETAYSKNNSSGHSTDNVNNTETRKQAAFNLGIRSDWAPFGDFPAGSLLIAQVRRDGLFRHSDIISIEVAQRSNQILALDDVDLYFIVNDCNDDLNRTNQGLQISVETRRQEGEIAKQVAQAMVDSLRYLEGRIDSILNQGDLSPQQMNTLREEMFMRLAADPRGRSKQHLGPVLHEFYQFWVENELLDLEKRSRIRRLERTIKNELSNLKRIESDIERTRNLEKLYELQKLWTLDSLDINQFTKDLKLALEQLNRFVIPVISFQAPERIEYLKTTDSVRFIRNGLNLETSVDEIARAVSRLYNDVAESDSLSRLVFNGWQTTDVILSFPKPGLSDLPRANPADNPLSIWKKGQRAMSEHIWNAFESRQDSTPVTLSITPNDLYDAHGAPGSLDCTKASPVIQSMGLFFLIPDGADEGPRPVYRFNLETRADGQMKFPEETRLQSFTMVGQSVETWLRQTIPYNVGLINQVESILNRDPATRIGSAAGLSPFMDFKFDFGRTPFRQGGELESYIPNIREILVVMKLKYRPATRPMNWMPVCAHAR